MIKKIKKMYFAAYKLRDLEEEDEGVVHFDFDVERLCMLLRNYMSM